MVRTTPSCNGICGEERSFARRTAELASSKALTAWATQRLATKNALTADDARAVETAFAGRLDEVTCLPASPDGSPLPCGGPRHLSPGARSKMPRTRLASLLWRLRRATTMKTGLFEIQAEH